MSILVEQEKPDQKPYKGPYRIWCDVEKSFGNIEGATPTCLGPAAERFLASSALGDGCDL
eukprot:925426-Amphidinium_carterae.1